MDCENGQLSLDAETALAYFVRIGVPVGVTEGYAAFCRGVAEVADIKLAPVSREVAPARSER